jgi:adenylate kinase
MMSSIIGGIPGVGKTTVLDQISEFIRVVNFGTVMLELSGLEDRDMLRTLPLEHQIELQKKAAEAINSMGNVVVDTHYSIKTPSGYLPGIPPWVMDRLGIERVIVIEVDEEMILKRRSKDPSRERDRESLADIKEHQWVNRAFAVSLAQMKGATLSIVKNDDGRAAECAERIKEIMKV